MAAVLKPFQRFFKPTHSIPSGIYTYTAPVDDPRNYRLHLRLEEEGGGVLIVNASTILHLNQTAGDYAYYLVHSTPPDEVAQKISSRYRVDPDQAKDDYLTFSARIQTLIDTPDIDPVSFLDFERQLPFSGQITAPYRLDCALTYQLPEGSSTDAVPHQEVKRELSTEEWKKLMDKAWQIGIPHIIFTGGEPTLRDDLVELLEHGEKIGMVTGLLTDGIRFSDDDYREKLLLTGLDHVMVILDTESEKAWEAVEESIEEDLFLAVHLTITSNNKDQILNYLDHLANIGVHEISISASAPEFASTLQIAREKIADLGHNLVWNLPVPYSAQHPVAEEIADLNISSEGSGRAYLYIEPDGDVRITQGADQVLGNFIETPWESIWEIAQSK
jgi:organic radical activating enzyme